MSKFRLITYSLDEVAMDYKHVARNLTRACLRPSGHYRITGVCQTHQHACFPCERSSGPAPTLRYVLAPLEVDPIEALAADLHTRWRSNFTTLGMIRMQASCLGLFAIADTPQEEPPS